MIRSLVRHGLIGLAILAPLPIAVLAGGSTPMPRAPVYTADGRLIPPTDYREWIFLGAGIDMSYAEKAKASAEPVFDNVFVNPEAYRVFLATGTWPDGTQLVSEIRGSSGHASINRRGRFQSGAPTGLEMHVKDVTRFEGSWAFFEIDGSKPSERLPESADCYACHRANAAVDTTFVQFYPTLLPIAVARGTLGTAYRAAEAKALVAPR